MSTSLRPSWEYWEASSTETSSACAATQCPQLATSSSMTSWRMEVFMIISTVHHLPSIIINNLLGADDCEFVAGDDLSIPFFARQVHCRSIVLRWSAFADVSIGIMRWCITICNWWPCMTCPLRLAMDTCHLDFCCSRHPEPTLPCG